MKKQTAVEWLAQKIYFEGLDDEFVKQAKQMEKEQIKVLEDKIENLEAEIWELGNQL